MASSEEDLYSFLTLRDPGKATLRERGSRFFSFAYPVRTISEIESVLATLRKEYPDATHHCYGWRLGVQPEMSKAHDDGEPKHSAGDPILGQIRSKGITNALVVVVRYFGGVQLGRSGLVLAYRTAAREALHRASIIRSEETQDVLIEGCHETVPEAMRLLKEFNAELTGQEHGERMALRLRVKRSRLKPLLERIARIAAANPGRSFEGKVTGS